MNKIFIYLGMDQPGLCIFTVEEFRIEEPESSYGSVRLDGESRFKAERFQTRVKRNFSVSETPDFTE